MDWDDSVEQTQALELVLATLDAVDSWVQQHSEFREISEVRQSLEAGQQVKTQDVELAPDGWAKLRQGVAKERHISLEDSDIEAYVRISLIYVALLLFTTFMFLLDYLSGSTMRVGLNAKRDMGYSYIRRGEQQHIHQPRQRGKRLSALGFLQPKKSFEYGLVVGGFNSERYLKLMDWQAEKAAAHLEKTGQITVVVQDGASFHKNNCVNQHWQHWQSRGLFLFFLPPYSPQMNRIEDEWLHLIHR